MEPFFQIDVTEDDIKLKEHFIRISDRLYYQKTRRTIGNRIFLLWWGIIVVSYILMPGEPDIIPIFLILIWILALSARLRRKVFLTVVFAIGRILRILRKESLLRNQIKFKDDEFTALLGNTPFAWPYNAVDQLAEDAHAYYIYFAKAKGMYFSKHCFTAGNPQEFKDFIIQKTGKNVAAMEKGGKPAHHK